MPFSMRQLLVGLLLAGSGASQVLAGVGEQVTPWQGAFLGTTGLTALIAGYMSTADRTTPALSDIFKKMRYLSGNLLPTAERSSAGSQQTNSRCA